MYFVCAVAHEGQKREPDPPELELWAQLGLGPLEDQQAIFMVNTLETGFHCFVCQASVIFPLSPSSRLLDYLTSQILVCPSNIQVLNSTAVTQIRFISETH